MNTNTKPASPQVIKRKDGKYYAGGNIVSGYHWVKDIGQAKIYTSMWDMNMDIFIFDLKNCRPIDVEIKEVEEK